ncbi:Aspartate/alanine antiporter [termite gut metagenome]|uniref:Aspartate/alanine antiporter n=1 Tax=termite gut metagenome TaxID=433724 RepID=A0A5J4S759_9ZZZZ
MNQISELLWGTGVAHTVMLLAFVIATGVTFGGVKIGGVSLGMTMVLFVGIAMSHFGFRMEHSVLHFVREFGLILFVYAVGLQVGPGFFSSFKKEGIQLNLLATGIVVLGVIITLIIHFISEVPMPTMVGILSGAVTNTPGLGAAQEAYSSMNGGVNEPGIALGYAVAYPLGVIGIIFSMIVIRSIFRVNLNKEIERLNVENSKKQNVVDTFSAEVKNPALFGESIQSLMDLIHLKFVISRVMSNDGIVHIASTETILNEGDKVFVITTPKNIRSVLAFIGKSVKLTMNDWHKPGCEVLSRKIIVTQPEINGKNISQINLRSRFGVNVTRINRSGIDLVAQSNVKLQIGDKVTVVGTESSLAGAETVLGNKVKRLNAPNLTPIFIGIFLGVLLGSIPFTFSGIPQPVKFGLAGGPLIVAILLSVFGTKLKLITYTTMSANLMIREIGISLFLAAVGLGAGEDFVETIVHGSGLNWVGLGIIITLVPLIIIGIVGRRFFRFDYFTLMGLLAGGTTDPPALAYATTTAGNDTPSVSYAAVYPLTMFLRVMSAQILILLF